ncbi:MAG: DUF2442 domain-containing protein [Tepidisphaeraceae bacterium]|jgi:hypothetical protein
MSIIVDETAARAISVKVTDDSVVVGLEDGRTIITPIVWYPRLLHGTPIERNNFEISGLGIHWPHLNEDLSVAGMLAGRKSGESPASIQRWLEYRARGEKEPIPTFPLPPDLEEELSKPEDAQGPNKG